MIKNSITPHGENLSNTEWNNINWQQAENSVKRLQIRIVKAVKENKWNLVKRLQYLLTHSFYAKAIAVKTVTSNHGKYTSGIDKVLWTNNKQKYEAITNINLSKYKAQPTKRIYIPKKNGKMRPLSIPTMYDRTIQTLQLLALQPIEETLADNNSFGFRKYRSCQDAMSKIFRLLCHKKDPEWILEGDIKGCFDNISHKWIMKNIPMNKKILNEFLKAGYIYNKKLFPNSKGAVQGGAISPTIANLTLDGLQQYVYHKINLGKRGEFYKSKNIYQIKFVRYADDFIVIGKNEEILKKVKLIIKEFLAERGLELSEEKTVITNIKNGFDFIGWNFRKYNGKLIIKPNKKSIQHIKDKISNTIHKNISSKQSKLITILNPIIIGWSNYNQSVCSRRTYQSLDAFLFKQLYYCWALKRHKQKGKKWINQKYWHNVKNRKWVFMEDKHILRSFTDTPIVRHYWLNTSKNPYIDEQYFKNLKQRLQSKKFHRRKQTAAFNLMS